MKNHQLQHITPGIRSLLGYYRKPEFVFRPIQIFVRFQRVTKPSHREVEEVILPWGLKIQIRPDDYIGRHVWEEGLYDLCVCESIYRLLEPGETAVDVGANIGQMTNLMAKKIGETGKVFAFEPHPDIHNDLITNVNYLPNKERIFPQKIAISDHSGEGVLGIPEDFSQNRGLASLVSDEKTVGVIENSYKVPLKTLDELFFDKEHIALLKIDVEFHELEVLKGATKLIENKQIRDILFEEHSEIPYPTPITDFLESRGYTLFYLYEDFLGLKVCDLKKAQKISYYYNCLATTEPDRALACLKQKGWTVLGPATPTTHLVHFVTNLRRNKKKKGGDAELA